MKNILILNGHPDAGKKHFCDAIAQKYASAAKAAGHNVQTIRANQLEFKLLSSKREFDQKATTPEAIQELQQQLLATDHFVVIYPLWMGDMPALLKGVFEQTFRPGFAIPKSGGDEGFESPLTGKTARIFVTMGMPKALYKWFYQAHTLKSLKRNILDFAGFKPVRATVVGKAFKGNESRLKLALSEVSRLGQLAK